MTHWRMPLTFPASELRAWMRLLAEPGLGLVQARRLVDQFSSPNAIYQLSLSDLRPHVSAALAVQMQGPEPNGLNNQLAAVLTWLEHAEHHVLTITDKRYPAQLAQLSDAPLLLYAKGRCQLLERPMLAIVGARRATAAGAANAYAFARHLANQGWTILSGLALGIDAAAHEGALAAGPDAASTIAVMGTGIELVYPTRHRALAGRIAHTGLLLSEMPLGTRALRYHFPRRNRLIAGLSQGVLVVEAARKSGSLITAHLAAELGREVFAIPGSIHSPLSRGCHTLIQEGAKLVESAQDIHNELPSPQPLHSATVATPSCPASVIVSPDCRIVLTALAWDPVHPDVLLQRSRLDIGRLSTALLELELKGLISARPDGRFERISRTTSL